MFTMPQTARRLALAFICFAAAVVHAQPPSGPPSTKNGIIVAVSGGNYSGEYIAFSLPGGSPRPSNQASH